MSYAFGLGVFVGNLLIHGWFCRDWHRGFWIGAMAGSLTILMYEFVNKVWPNVSGMR